MGLLDALQRLDERFGVGPKLPPPHGPHDGQLPLLLLAGLLFWVLHPRDILALARRVDHLVPVMSRRDLLRRMAPWLLLFIAVTALSIPDIWFGVSLLTSGLLLVLMAIKLHRLEEHLDVDILARLWWICPIGMYVRPKRSG